MEFISTVKMKKAQDLALAKKDFVLEMLKVLGILTVCGT
jgi:F0F1-type ATP synthase gamma subunit